MERTQREQTVRVIDSTIRELQGLRDELVPHDKADATHELAEDLSHIDPEVAAMVHSELQALWCEHQGDGFYRGRSLVIDLKTVEGRAQMLVLANLLAARASESIAEATFLALAHAGLLQHERLIAGSEDDRNQALEILRTTYRALADKERKVDAIYHNQALLAKTWSGDLQNLYEEAMGDGSRVIEGLHSFMHLQRRAYWLAREMKVSGLWPGLGTEATAYYDVHVRRVLARLGFTRFSGTGSWNASYRECQKVVDTWFEGDFVPLYLHGSRLCIHDDRAICADSCPIKENCSFWSQGSEQSSGEGVD